MAPARRAPARGGRHPQPLSLSRSPSRPRAGRLSDWLARASPGAYLALRRPWRKIRPYLPLPDRYWEQRKSYQYYAHVVRLARLHVPAGGRVLDVGAGVARLLERLDWFDDRLALDANATRRQRGVDRVMVDFLDYQPDAMFDLVLCLQVLEHVDDPATFAQKLLATGRTVIISVPYKWPAGGTATHRHDPVDERKLDTWTQRTPLDMRIVEDDGRQRLIAVYGNQRR